MALYFFIFDPALTFNVHMSIRSYIIFNIPTLRNGVNHENTLIATISGQMGLVERRRRFEPPLADTCSALALGSFRIQ